MTAPEPPNMSAEHPAATTYPLGCHAMGSITIHTATPDALQSIALRLCKDDREELTALGHLAPHSVITASQKASREVYVAHWDGEAQAVFGVMDYPEDHRFGIPWMLSTGTGHRHRRAFMEVSRRMINVWSPMYMALANIVSDQHPTASAWLEALGFAPLATHAVNGHAFTEYGRFSYV
jgi:hypothetical protein